MRSLNSVPAFAKVQRAVSNQDYSLKPEFMKQIKVTIDENQSVDEKSQFNGAYQSKYIPPRHNAREIRCHHI